MSLFWKVPVSLLEFWQDINRLSPFRSSRVAVSLVGIYPLQGPIYIYIPGKSTGARLLALLSSSGHIDYISAALAHQVGFPRLCHEQSSFLFKTPGTAVKTYWITFSSRVWPSNRGIWSCQSGISQCCRFYLLVCSTYICKLHDWSKIWKRSTWKSTPMVAL